MMQKWSELSTEEQEKQIKDGRFLEIEVAGVSVIILSIKPNPENNTCETEWVAEGFDLMSEQEKKIFSGHVDSAVLVYISNEMNNMKEAKRDSEV